jgi:hypothetical protein
MGKRTYPGGGTNINAGPHGDPGGRGVGSRASPRLKRSQRLPDVVPWDILTRTQSRCTRHKTRAPSHW